MNIDSTLIQNGQVYDGTGAEAQRVDVRIAKGVIQEVGPDLPSQGETIVDATGLLVCPGLIDLHVHVFSGVGLYSIDPVEAGLRTGVTSMLDTGTAGALTYPNMARFILPAAEEDVFTLLNISMIGAIQGHPDFPPFMGDLNDGRHAHVPSAVECARKYPKNLVGMKVRLTSALANYDEKNELAGFEGVFEAADQMGRPLMIHHAASRIPTTTVLNALRSGDMYTHLFHPHPDHAFADDGMPIDELLEARARGVIFDVGHGVGAFVWRVAEPACEKYGFWPDTISTDLHHFNLRGPVVDLPTTMSKFLYLGMPVKDIVQAVTLNAARAMRVDDRLGSIQTGKQADITLLKLEKGLFALSDAEGVIRHSSQRLTAEFVCKRGVWHRCGLPHP
jgi:dihydroorotase